MTTTYLVACNGTRGSWRALSYAIGLARRHAGGCRLVAVSVALPAERFGLLPEIVPLVRASILHDANELRHALEQMLEDTEVEWSLRTEPGETFRVLARVADEEHADAVVVGATMRRRTFWRRPVSECLTKVARYPVIVVP